MERMKDKLTDTRERSVCLRLLSRAAVVIVAGLAAAVVHAQSPDPADLAEGMRLFQQKGNCQACHGWAGDGRKMDNQMPDGANLRETKLDRKTLIMVTKCGLPGTGMPAFDRLAYSDGRCYGRKQADLRALGTTLPDPPATLQPREVETLVDFLLAKIVGKGLMDRAKCIDYWGSEVEACREFAK
jgi:mono/diheme cytochrome c family protein